MKKIVKLKTSLLGVCILLMSVISGRVSAQVTCPYVITNNLSCPVQVMWTLYDVGLGCGSCNVSSTAITVNAGVGATITCADFNVAPCGGNFSICDVDVTVVTINGSGAGLPVTANSGSPNPSLPTSGCTGASPNVSWLGGNCIINP